MADTVVEISPMEQFKAAERKKQALERRWRASATYKDFQCESATRKERLSKELKEREGEWKVAFRTGMLVAMHDIVGAPLQPHKFRHIVETPEEAARMDLFWRRYMLSAGSKIWLDEVKEEMRVKEVWMRGAGDGCENET